MKFSIKEKIWLYPGMAAWHFLTVPKKESEKIKKEFGAKKRGWGSVPVKVTLGKTSWNTSIFPDKQSGCYLLPLKAEVRRKESVAHGDIINFVLDVQG